MLLRQFRKGYKDPTRNSCSLLHSSQAIVMHIPRKIHQYPMPHAHARRSGSSTHPCAAHLEYQRSTLGLLVTTISPEVSNLSQHTPSFSPSSNLHQTRMTYPSSKCLHRFNANCAFVLQDVHSNLNTTFFVVLAFLWNTGLV